MRPAGADRGANLAGLPRGVSGGGSGERSGAAGPVLGRLAPKARVVLCGVISSYLTGEHPGPSNYVNLLAKTASMQGFNALEMWDRFDEAFASGSLGVYSLRR